MVKVLWLCLLLNDGREISPTSDCKNPPPIHLPLVVYIGMVHNKFCLIF